MEILVRLGMLKECVNNLYKRSIFIHQTSMLTFSQLLSSTMSPPSKSTPLYVDPPLRPHSVARHDTASVYHFYRQTFQQSRQFTKETDKRLLCAPGYEGKTHPIHF